MKWRSSCRGHRLVMRSSRVRLLLDGHGDRQPLLGLDQVVDVLRDLVDVDLDPSHADLAAGG
jgi:hypothetical protein